MKRALVLVGALIALGCGSDVETENGSEEATSTSAQSAGGTGGAGGAGGGGPGGAAGLDCSEVPDPGFVPLGPDYTYGEKEPNDTPALATPLGLLQDTAAGIPGYQGVGWMYPWETSIGPSDPFDYLVIRTDADVIGMVMVNHDFSVAANLLDHAVYEVAAGACTLVFESKTKATDHEGDNQTWKPVAVKPMTVYLVELRHVEGQGSYRT